MSRERESRRLALQSTAELWRGLARRPSPEHTIGDPLSFEARYHSTCGTCDETIAPGQRARHDEAGCVVHVKCPDPVDQDAPRRNEKRCNCNLIHAGKCF